MLVVELDKEFIHVVRGAEEDFVGGFFWVFRATREDDVLWFELEYLLLADEGFTVDVISVAEVAEFLRRDVDLLGFKVRQRHFTRVVTQRAIFVDVNAVFCAKDAFDEMLGDVLFVGRAADAFDEVRVDCCAYLLEAAGKERFDINAANTAGFGVVGAVLNHTACGAVFKS